MCIHVDIYIYIYAYIHITLCYATLGNVALTYITFNYHNTCYIVLLHYIML